MAVSIWVTATIMIVVFAVAVFSLAPVQYLVANAMNRTATSSISDPDALNAANLALTVGNYAWTIAVAGGVLAIVVWAYMRPSHRESESYYLSD